MPNGRTSIFGCTLAALTQLTNAFSKKIENHAHSVALFAMYYNFVRIHKTLRTTPAMAAKVTERLWEIGDILGALETWEGTMSENATFPTDTSLRREIAEYCKRYCIEPYFPVSDSWDIQTGYRENRKFPDVGEAGCYAIYAEDGELLYIGKAWEIGSRLGTYFMGIRSKSPGATRPDHIWTKPPKYIQTIRVRESFEASSLEEYLIQKLRPCDNSRIG